MRVLSIVHEADAGAGVFADAAGELGAELVEWLPHEQGPLPGLDRVGAAFVFGGAMNVHEEAANPWLRGEKELLRALLARDLPVLGVCLGAQLVSEALGGSVGRAPRAEIGWHDVRLTEAGRADPVLAGFEPPAFQWHSYAFSLPPRAAALAESDVCPQAWRLGNTWAIQFHAEVTEASVGAWAADYASDPDAVALGLDPEALIEETTARIGAWNETGRGIARRFLEAAAG